MKKIIFGLCLILISAFVKSQGLQNVIVERYYISNAADAAGSSGTLPVGSVTYRFYVQMAAGYTFQAAYGINNPLHELRFGTTTSFFNNTDRGATTPNGISKANLTGNSVMLDSWLSGGAACGTYMGVLKTEDDGVNTVVNANGILHNNDVHAGIPLTTQDGMILSTVPSTKTIGIDGIIGVFGDGTANGNLFSTTNGSWYSDQSNPGHLNAGSFGPTSNNRVLIAQITTDGVLDYKLNIQIGTPTGTTENYVAENAGSGELQRDYLKGLLGVVPTVSITNPIDGAHVITGDVVNIAANASEVGGGTITQVEFFVNGVSVGVSTSAPYNVNWTSTAGSKVLTAVATDNAGFTKTSAPVNITVANNQAPTVSVTAPADGSSAKVGTTVNITADASDIDGTVSKVEFYVNNVKIGEDLTSPYAFSWTAVLGTNRITAVATDNKGAQTTSSIVTINVVNNLPPTVSITSPANGAAFMKNNVVTIAASSSDADGTVSKVEFFVNGVKVGEDLTSPYSYDWTATVGTKSLTAVATDNNGATTLSAPVSINVADPNALPYTIANIASKCTSTMDCIPLTANDTVKDCIGFDVDIVYNPAKVLPTGFVTIGSDLINPAYASYVSHVVPASNTLKVSVYITSNAPAGTTFHGKGNVFCAQFSKTSNFGSVDTARFTVSRAAESYNMSVVTKLVTPGLYTSYKDSIFNGSLKYWADNSPIAYNKANPNQHLITNIYGASRLTSVNPDLNGDFVYNANNGATINIERDILNTTDVLSVINGQDALLTKKVLIDDLSFIPNVFQLIAMDVNMDGVVSAGDLSQMSQRSILKLGEFKQAWNYDNHGVSNGQKSKDWLFVNSTILNDPSYKISSTYPSSDGLGYSKFVVPQVAVNIALPILNYSSCPIISSENYMGVLLGDVDGNYMNIASSGLLKKADNNEVVFDLANAKAGIGYIDVPVSVSSNDAIHALDFSLQFNQPKMQFESANVLSGNMNQSAYYNENDQTLRFTSYSLSAYNKNAAVASVRFSTASSSISGKDLTSATAYLNGNPAKVKVTESTLGISENAKANGVNVYPNPASSVINIEATQNADIQLMDINGQQIFLQSKVNANQKQVLDVQNLANGIYLIKIYNDSFVSMQKVIINK